MIKSFNAPIDVKLIRLVKEHPVIYDYNNPKYMDFNAREVAWQKIGDELKRPAADCKVRWINMRDVYRRILRRNIIEGKHTRMYKYEPSIGFMRAYFKDIAVEPSEPTLDEMAQYNELNSWNETMMDNDDPEQESFESEDRETPVKKPRKPAKKRKRKTVIKEELDDAEDDEPLMPPSFADTSHPEFDSSDAVDAFLLNIGATLKTFSPYHLNLAKTKIFSVVQQYELQQIVKGRDHQPDVKVSTSEAVFLEDS